MFVTLEVSKLSGWLNADADCRESKAGHTVRGARVRDSRRGRRRPACSGGSTADWGQNRRGAHLEHLPHVRDAGGVPVGYICVENMSDTVNIVIEELAHVGDGRDVP
eukprot:scaffold109703_cov52-Phaeocystis_antarctica.AAC.2